MGKQPSILDFSTTDLSKEIASKEEIRKYNSQRFEMEMLDGILYEDSKTRVCVAYQDVSSDAFWVRGHMPGFPLMPGVLMCECAAQAASYVASKEVCLPEDYIVGLGGLDGVKIRGSVRPGDRLLVVARLESVRHNTLLVSFEAVVNGEVVAEGKIRGIGFRKE
ncbi:MAG: 3-hydroxyacyl-ACP dehydratase FabZ family protein [Planctomycetia bacterium]|nr:3-hydroxyacyl-ACP dehydratase FabZ family protein [Planctomycetia bacterium]